MKLTGALKDKVDTAETMEEKKAIIAQAGMELTDGELEYVAGGSPIKQPYCSQKPRGWTQEAYPPKPKA